MTKTHIFSHTHPLACRQAHTAATTRAPHAHIHAAASNDRWFGLVCGATHGWGKDPSVSFVPRLSTEIEYFAYNRTKI